MGGGPRPMHGGQAGEVHGAGEQGPEAGAGWGGTGGHSGGGSGAGGGAKEQCEANQAHPGFWEEREERK
jgi:hypothetical protein